MQQQFWTAEQLRSAGISKRRVAAAVVDGRLLVVRRGHYAITGTPPDLVRAARVGGLATATTASAELGLWTPPDTRLHVAMPRGIGRLRDPDDPQRPLPRRSDVCIHWTDGLGSTDLPRRIVPTVLLLEHALRDLPPAMALTVVDSALHHRMLRPDGLRSLIAALPARLAAVARCADASSESGLETITRYLLRLAGLRVETQVSVAGLGRVDLLVEGHVIVELDGWEFHGDEKAFENDRRRDAVAAVGRYRVLRFTYSQVMYDWPCSARLHAAGTRGQASPSTSRIHASSKARSRQAA